MERKFYSKKGYIFFVLAFVFLVTLGLVFYDVKEMQLMAKEMTGHSVSTESADTGSSNAVVEEAESSIPWWGWPIMLFVSCFLLGIVAVMGGVGGGVLFVPIIGGFFPFHLDYVRGTGLFIALAGSLAAGPRLLRGGIASLKLAMPCALIASSAAIVGAMIGLALPQQVVQIALGVTILGILIIMVSAKKSEFPEVKKADNLSTALGITGIYYEPTTGQTFDWKIHRTAQGLILFVIIGLMAGMFGLGAGWANVPVLNLLMGAPLKVSVATSSFLLSITDTTAAWVYMHNGAVLPMITVPSLIGMMLGAMIGARLLARVKPAVVKKLVLTMLFIAGIRSLLKGLGIWT